MDVATFQQLKALRNSLSQRYNGFPFEYCRISHEAVKDKFGFERTFGLFIDNNGIGHGHHWNLTPSGEIVDITASQFDEHLPEVYVLDNNSLEAQKHYLEGVYYMI